MSKIVKHIGGALNGPIIIAVLLALYGLAFVTQVVQAAIA